jgi:FkbH-like protein
VKILIVSSYTVRLIDHELKKQLAALGFEGVESVIDEYNLMYNIISPDSVLGKTLDADFVVLMYRAEDLTDSDGFIAHVKALRHRVKATLILGDVVVPAVDNLYDCNSADSKRDRAAELGKKIKCALLDQPSLYFIDMDSMASRIGHDNFFDPRLWYTSMTPFSGPGIKEIARTLARVINASSRPAKKCIVLDCDNTLWGGIIGEDLIDGIKLGPDYPGNCYVEFQRRIKQLSGTGYVLAINSKNNESDVFEVLDTHPSQVLQKSDFACMKINWNSKVQNMIEIARELNIGLDSLVYFDDNPVEIQLLMENLPEVESIEVSKNPLEIMDAISASSLPDRLRITAEDRKKTTMYRKNLQRESLRKSVTDIEDFYRGLQMHMEVRKNLHADVQRIAQMTQKTNQFNIATVRRNEGDIVDFQQDKAYNLYAFSLVDKFGDNGIVGYCEVSLSDVEPVATVVNFLMSCRVVSRTAEFEFMSRLLEDLHTNHGIQTVHARWVRSEKNKPCETFLDDFGFTTPGGEDEKSYLLQLDGFEIKHRDYFNVSWKTE